MVDTCGDLVDTIAPLLDVRHTNIIAHRPVGIAATTSKTWETRRSFT